MGPETVNRLKDSEIHGDFVGHDKITNIIMFQESEREFVVTHNVNIKPVAYFTGRETELQDLRQRIEEGRKSVLVSGMGGIGKTHICRKLFEEYLNKHAEDENGPFRHLGYIEYNGDMDSSLQNCLKFKQQDRPEQNQEAAWRELEYLAADGKLLLFVDNVDKSIRADLGLQKLKEIPGAIVLTSRLVSFSDEFEPYRIGFLGMERCKEIYGKIRFGSSGRKVGSEEDPDLEYIIECLAGRHTITVEFLAHLARTKTWLVGDLRKKLEEKGFCLTFHKDGKFVNIQESYEKLYDLSELTEAERNILEAFSVFPYIPLAAETCNEWLLADAGVSEDDDILMGLYQKGWLQFDMDQEGYALHPVFAQFISEKCNPKMEEHLGLMKECQRNLIISENGSALKGQKYIPFAENIIEKINAGESMQRTRFMSALAYLFCYIAEYKKAEKLYKRSLQIRQKILGEENLDTATSYSNLAEVYRHQGRYREAEELYGRSLQNRKKALGEMHLDIAISYSELASVYGYQGRYKEAEELLKKSLGIRQKIQGTENLYLAANYNDLAQMCRNQGNYREAEELYKKSIQIYENIVGEEHLYTAIDYGNLAWMYQTLGKYREAEKLEKKGYRLKKRCLERNILLRSEAMIIWQKYIGAGASTEKRKSYIKNVYRLDKNYLERNILRRLEVIMVWEKYIRIKESTRKQKSFVKKVYLLEKRYWE